MTDDTSPTPEPASNASAAVATQAAFSLRQQLEFTRKELRETLRDRRTTITLIVMPLLLYPLLGLGLRAIAFQQSDEAATAYELAVETEREALWLNDALQLGEQAMAAVEGSPPKPEFQILVPEDLSDFDLQSSVSELATDLGVRVVFGQANAATGQNARVQIFENESSTRSRDAADAVEQRLAAANIALIKNWAASRGQELPIPLQQSRVLVEPAETGSAILGLLPLVLLLMTVTGGVYPAIDLTAGERERNTMETLMALPVPRSRLLAAKYVAVVTVTMLTGCVNVLAMSVTLYAMQLDETLLGDGGFTIDLALRLLLALAAFALFYSAVLLLLTSSARSFKEAQAYLIPLLLVSIAPGLVVILPGWQLTNLTAAIPLVNILLLTQELIEGTVQQLPAMVAIISTVLYGAAALSLASLVFGDDAASVGSRGRWQDLVQRPTAASTSPSTPSTVLTLALLFPVYFIASGVLGRGEAAPIVRLASSAALTVCLFVVIPWLALRWQRVPLVSGLQLTWPRWPYGVAAVLLGLTAWPWVFELVVLAQGMGLRGISPEQIEKVESLLASWENVPTWAIVLCLGIVPGVCEECFFRGYLFNGLRQHFGAAGTIGLSAIAFGLFHVVLAGGAAPERILPSTLMGALLGWVAWQSGSTIPSIMLHAIHNSTLLIVAKSRGTLAGWNIGQLEQEHLPWWWLAISAAVLLAAIAAVQGINRRSPATELATA